MRTFGGNCFLLAGLLLFGMSLSVAVGSTTEPIRVWLMKTGTPVPVEEAGRERVATFRERYGDLLWLTPKEERNLERRTRSGRLLLAQEPLLAHVKSALIANVDTANIALKIRFREWNEISRFESEIEESLRSREPVNLVELGTSQVADMLGEGKLIHAFRRTDFGASDLCDILIDTKWATTLFRCPINGFIRGVPRQLDARLLWFWPDLFDDNAANIANAATLTELNDSIGGHFRRDKENSRSAFGMVRADQNAFHTLTALAAAFGIEEGESDFSRPLGFLQSLAKVPSRLAFYQTEDALLEAFRSEQAIASIISGPWVLQYTQRTPGVRLLPGDTKGGTIKVDATKGSLLCRTRVDPGNVRKLATIACLLVRAPGPAWSAAHPISDDLPEALKVLGRLYLDQPGPDDPAIQLSTNAFDDQDAMRLSREQGVHARRLAHFLRQLADPARARGLDPARVYDTTPLERAQPWILGIIAVLLSAGIIVAFRWWRERILTAIVSATCCIKCGSNLADHIGLGTKVRFGGSASPVLVTCKHVVKKVYEKRRETMPASGSTIDLVVANWEKKDFDNCCDSELKSFELLYTNELDVAFLQPNSDDKSKGIKAHLTVVGTHRFVKFSSKKEKNTLMNSFYRHVIYSGRIDGLFGDPNPAHDMSVGNTYGLTWKGVRGEIIQGSSGGGIFSRWTARWSGLIATAQDGVENAGVISSQNVIKAWEKTLEKNPTPAD